MSEENQKPQTEGTQAVVSTTVPMIIYVLYLVSLLVGITSIVGVIMAYINKGDGNYLDSHYQFQIRTFWIGLLYTIIGVVLTAVMIGWIIILFVLVWYIVRCVKGIKYLGKQESIPEPTSWMFG
ncbi:membrane protein [Thiomicrorhabdus sp. Kp2]|uniref:DUF4870 family protein n=1 Tax=Thiomicrorhabdus sp. Kp2 TaxID=1123518 RepID=UPI00041775D1|nr:membrane protein [Thiomicrorhabdus sp. Kp2]